MKIYKVGDEKRAECAVCQSFQTVTFQLRDVPFSDGSGRVKNVVVGVCKACDSVALIPFQSVPANKRLSLKGREIHNDIHELKLLSQITNTTELLKGVVLAINNDVLINPDNQRIAHLKSLVATVA